MKRLPLFILCVIPLVGCSAGQTSNSEDSLFESESEAVVEKDEAIYYTSHPTSEPHINYQNHTFSAIGDINSVWEYYRGDGVKVAVIDNNFRVTHEDFYYENGESKISSNSARIYKNNGQIITEVGIDKAGIDASSNWHGTMCAGLLGASVNGKGTTGVAPNCELTLIKVDNSPEAISEAFRYAADIGVKVISISLGNYANPNGASSGDIVYPRGFDLSTAFNEDINYAYSKGVTIVSAVGNDKKTQLTYPAGCENVIGAGGLNAYSLNELWDEGYEGSNYNGSVEYVDVYAPSSGIYTPGSQSNSGYMDGANAKGTSFSAPIIAGAAALYFQKYPEHTNVDFENALKRTCRDISSYNPNKDTGWGALDVYKLLNLDEDIKSVSYQPTTTVNQNATSIRVFDESNWLFRSLHTWGYSFDEGYGYRDLEYFFLHHYGERTLTNNYQVEGSSRGWAYTDEYFIGDYFLNAGKLTNNYYEFIFPSWVSGFSYQCVNNSNWLPENGGLSTYKLNSHLKINEIYINNGEVYTNVGSSFKVDMPAVTIEFVGQGNLSSQITSIYDYYLLIDQERNFYLDENKNTPYYRQVLKKDTILYFDVK